MPASAPEDEQRARGCLASELADGVCGPARYHELCSHGAGGCAATPAIDETAAAQRFGVRFRFVPVNPQSQAAQEDREPGLLRGLQVDLVVLAGETPFERWRVHPRRYRMNGQKPTRQRSLGLWVACSLSLASATAEEAVAPKQTGPDPSMLPLIAEKHYSCAECHRVDSTLVGPSFREIASRRKGHPYAAALLANKIWNGGTGDYGPTSMPSHMGQVSDEDVPAIVAWILSLDAVGSDRGTHMTAGDVR